MKSIEIILVAIFGSIVLIGFIASFIRKKPKNTNQIEPGETPGGGYIDNPNDKPGDKPVDDDINGDADKPNDNPEGGKPDNDIIN